MKDVNKLVELIKAMSSSEKGYFKKYTLIHAQAQDQIYIEMFNIISSQKEYDEEKLVSALKKKSASKKFGPLQSYLYKLILKSLRAYHNSVPFSTKTFELLTDSVLLKEKGLFAQSNKILEQAKESAIEEDDQILLLKIRQLQGENNIRKPNIKSMEFNCEELYPEMNELTNNIKHEIAITLLQNRIYLIYLKYGHQITDPEIETQVEKILNDPLLTTGHKNYTREILYRVFTIRNLCYSILRNNISAVNNSKMHVAALERDPLFHTERVKIKYGLLLCNLLTEFLVLSIEEMQEMFKKIQSIKTNSFTKEIDLFIYSYSNMLGAYINLQMPEKGVILIPETVKKLNTYKNKLSDEALLIFQYNISTLYFMVSDHTNALKWMNKTLDHSGKDMRKDTYLDIRVLNILIHYELENFQLFDSLLLSLERFLIKNKSMNIFSKTVIYHLKKILFLRDKKEIKEQLLLLKNQLSPILKNEKYKRIYLLSWIDKKLKVSSKK